MRGSVVVVTGASSGLGRATALAFASRGARVVAAARTNSALDSVVAECRLLGGEALAVPTDVGDADQIDALADAATGAFGHIDTWVNVAAVLAAGELGDQPPEEIERLVRTNVLGAALGGRAALRQFREQGSGVLIDVSSLLGLVSNPLVPTYVMSKFAVRGLSMSLHHAVARDPDIHVCVVLPGPIDTPLFQRSANHTGRALRAIPPAMAPSRIAAAIVACAERPRRRVVVGVLGHAALVAHALSSRATDWFVARYSAAALLSGEPSARTSGALFDARADGQVEGGWRWGTWRRALADRAARRALDH